MARIRTIKPEFPQSETVGALSRDARLLFIQLWTVADDAGRLRGASRMLASLLYPYDDDAVKLIGRWLDELERNNCIRRYEVDGSQYVEIINWLKHQKIDRPSESRLPPYSEGSMKPREPSRAIDADLVPSTSTKDGGADAHLPVKKDRRRATQYPDGFSPDFAKATSAGLSRAEAEREAIKFRNHAVERGRTCIDWQAAWHNWCLKAAEFMGRKPPEARATGPVIPNEFAVKLFHDNGHWNVAYGPEPGKPGCRAPTEILAKFGYTEAA